MRKLHDKLMKESFWYNRWHNNSAHQMTHWFFFLVVALLLAGSLSDNLIKHYGTQSPDQPAAASLAASITAKYSRKVPGQYIIVFKDTVKDPKKTAQEMANTYGGEIKYVYSKVLNGFAGNFPEVALQGLRNNPNIKLVEQDQTVQATGIENPTPSWGLDRVDQASLPLDNSYTYNYSGSGVNAYIIDTGIRSTHVEFTGRMGNGYTAINDGYGIDGCHWHGTHVAGTVGGSTVGIAKSVTLHSVRVLDCNGSGTMSGVIAGVDWVANNKVLPAVANLSLSGGFTQTLNDAVKNLVNSGVVVAVAAGNSASDACGYSPSSEPTVLTVGATTNLDGQASYSNYGTCLDLYAPGSSIYSAWSTNDTSYGSANGTSMASPHVAGIAALYLQQNPSATPTTVMDAIKSKGTSGVLGSLGVGSPNVLANSLFSGNAGTNPPPSGDTQSPSTPTNLTGSAPDTAHVNLSWTASTDNVGVQGYKVYRSSVLVGNVSGTTYTDSSAVAGSVYSYAVAAYDAAGNNSGMSNSISITVPYTTGVLDILSYSISSITSTSAVLSWTTNIGSNATVQYSSRNIATKTLYDNTNSTNHSMIISGLKAGTTYAYAINASSGSYTDYVNGSFKTSRK